MLPMIAAKPGIDPPGAHACTLSQSCGQGAVLTGCFRASSGVKDGISPMYFIWAGSKASGKIRVLLPEDGAGY